MTQPTEALRAQLLERENSALAQLLIQLAFIVERGTNVGPETDFGKALGAYRDAVRAAAAALAGQEELPEAGTITNCHCGRCHCGFYPEGKATHALGCCVMEHRDAAVREWQRAMRERDDEIKTLIDENNRLRVPLAGPPPAQEQEHKMSDEIPRRNRMDRWHPAERAIYDAMQAVEAMPADVRLTDAVVQLGAAKDSVADYLDGVARRVPNESLFVQHARKQGEADGFQIGWHAALKRMSEGDRIADLRELVPICERRSPDGDGHEKGTGVGTETSAPERPTTGTSQGTDLEGRAGKPRAAELPLSATSTESPVVEALGRADGSNPSGAHQKALAASSSPWQPSKGTSMKIRVTLKDPDTMHDAVDDAFAKLAAPAGVTDEEWRQLRAQRAVEAKSTIGDKWMPYGEYLSVEFDLDAGTAVVLPANEDL